MVRKGIVFAVFLLVCCMEGWAARPFSIDDAGTVEQGKFELELGYENCNDITAGQSSLFALGLKHGLTDRMDIGIGLGQTFIPEQAEGLSPSNLSLKFAVIKDLLAVSFAQDLGSSAYQLNSALSKEFGPIETNINLGYAATGVSNIPGSITYGLDLIYGFKKLDVGCEFSGDKDGFQEWLIGGSYSVIDALAVDLGYEGNFSDASGEVTAGLHYSF